MTDADVRRVIYDLTIRNGSTPAVGGVAAELGAAEAEVRDAFHSLASQRILVLDGDDIRMAAPFSGVPTSFVVRANGVSYYANCIWDALGVSPMLKVDSIIETTCPDCAMPLELEVRNAGVSPAGQAASRRPERDAPGPAGGDAGVPIVHFSVPARQWWADIVYT